MAKTARVGLIADTHVGEYLQALPAAVLEVFEGCDLIIHAGDHSDLSVIEALDDLAPVVAVHGDHDRGPTGDLPEIAGVRVAGHRIAVIHGNRLKPIDWSVVAVHLAAGRKVAWRAGLHKALLERTGPVDCLVYGHWHEPVAERVGSTLVCSPGAVCPMGSLQNGRAPGSGLTGLIDRAVGRYRRQLGVEAMRPQVAILEIGSGGIRPRHVPLDTPGLASGSG